jgi:hypothetical protein
VTGGRDDPAVTSRSGDVPQRRAAPTRGPRTAQRSTGRKVLASLGALTAWAGVTGLGTFGTLTDEATPLDGGVDGGAVSLGLGATDGLGTVPLTVGGLLPGGSVTRTMDLVNDGDVPLWSVRLASVATTSSRLDADPAEGLQLTLHASCQ